jgi:hypothetical protein
MWSRKNKKQGEEERENKGKRHQITDNERKVARQDKKR